MNKFFFWLLNPPTDGPKSTLLLRLMAGGVFFWEGILKFVYVEPGSRPFYETGDTVSAFHRGLHRLPRDRWRAARCSPA